MSTAHHPFGEAPGPAGLDRRFRKPLMSFFLRRTGDWTEAEDLTQQTFLRLLQDAEASPRGRRTDAFVFTVAANLLRDRWRKLRGRDPAAPVPAARFVDIAEVGDSLPDEASPERVLLGREDLAEALAALDELGARTRDIFVLFKIQNLKHREIAAIYGISPSAVEKQIMKAALHLALKFGRP